MALKEIVENNPVLMTLSLLLVGFLSGVALAHQLLALLEGAHAGAICRLYDADEYPPRPAIGASAGSRDFVSWHQAY